jgi:tetrahydromethanopterin S-methyltransferase subunit C
MLRYFVAIFQNREQAEAAVTELEAHGFPPAELSIVADQRYGGTLIDELGANDAPAVTGGNAIQQEENLGAVETGIKAGAGLGAVAGAIAGAALVGVTTGGIGLLVAGPIAGALAGGVTGAAVGGLTGALIGMGIPREDAMRLEERVAAGSILVMFKEDESRAPEVEEIMNRHGVEEMMMTGLQGVTDDR